MYNRVAKHAVNILMESPFYLAMSLKERQRLIREFVAMYSLPSEEPEPESTRELAPITKETFH